MRQVSSNRWSWCSELALEIQSWAEAVLPGPSDQALSPTHCHGVMVLDGHGRSTLCKTKNWLLESLPFRKKDTKCFLNNIYLLGFPGGSGVKNPLPMQETGVQSLVWEDPTCLRAAKPVCHNYWACALEPRRLTTEPGYCNYWSPCS